MNKCLFVVCFILISLTSYAQVSEKYLEGAVPEVEGKVRFHKTISVKESVSRDQLFSLMDNWAKQNYTSNVDDLQNRILLSNPETYNIACAGEDYLEFQKTVLSLDRAKMIYQLVLEVKDGACDVTIRNIKYDYSDRKELFFAEDQITDKVALHKNKDKLNRYYDKFRIFTVDKVEDIFNSIDVYLNGVNSSGVVTAVSSSQNVEQVPASKSLPSTQNVATGGEVSSHQAIEIPVPSYSIASNTSENSAIVSSGTDMEGYRLIAADKIPGNIVKLLDDAVLITSGTSEKMNVMTASWGGLGRFWEKPVTFCFLNPTRYSVQTMDKGETYTISFYTEAYRDAIQYCGSVSGHNVDKIKGSGLTPIKTPSGAMAFAESWMIIECRKVVAQPISSSAVVDKELAKDWSKDGYHKMYIGEILNVWVK